MPARWLIYRAGYPVDWHPAIVGSANPIGKDRMTGQQATGQPGSLP